MINKSRHERRAIAPEPAKPVVAEADEPSEPTVSTVRANRWTVIQEAIKSWKATFRLCLILVVMGLSVSVSGSGLYLLLAHVLHWH